MPHRHFRFELHHVDAHTGARREHAAHAARRRRAAGVHARRHAGHGQGRRRRPPPRHGRPDGARQHLPPRPAARRGDRRGARRPARLHGLGRARSSPTAAASRSSASPTACSVTEDGVEFRSHIDGALVELTPERSIAIQERARRDLIMQFDHVVALPNAPDVGRRRHCAQRPLGRALPRGRRRAATRCCWPSCRAGSTRRCAASAPRQLVAMDFPGYAVGGLSVGEPPAEMYAALDAVVPALPADRPRYLMGVGRPQDLVEGDRPRHRPVRLRDADAQRPQRPGVHRRRPAAAAQRGPPARPRSRSRPHCPCPACRHSRGYLRHLFQAGEMLGPILASIHNLTYYQRLLAEAREAIAADRFARVPQPQAPRLGTSTARSTRLARRADAFDGCQAEAGLRPARTPLLVVASWIYDESTHA